MVILLKKLLTSNLQLREILHISIPRIRSYSLDPHNPVGAEYIIEEKAEGISLGSVWFKWPKEAQLDLVTELVDLETRLASVSFQKHGCIYLKGDLEDNNVPIQNVDAIFSVLGKQIDGALMTKFAFGPLTHSTIWEGERSQMELDRGPCKFL